MGSRAADLVLYVVVDHFLLGLTRLLLTNSRNLGILQDPFRGHESAQETSHMYRTPSPVPSLTLSGGGTSACSSMSPPSRRVPTTPPMCSPTPTTEPRVQAKVDQSDMDSPNESWMSSFIFTPQDSASSASGLGLMNHDGTSVRQIDATPTLTPTTARSLMDRHLSQIRLSSAPSPKDRAARVANLQPTTLSALTDVFLYSPSPSASPCGYHEYDPSVLPSYATLDKDMHIDASSPSFLPSGSSPYAPVLYPFDVTHGRAVQFDFDARDVLPIARSEKTTRKTTGRCAGAGQNGRRAKSVRGAEAWVDVTVPRVAAVAWKSSPHGAVGDGRPREVARKAT